MRLQSAHWGIAPEGDGLASLISYSNTDEKWS